MPESLKPQRWTEFVDETEPLPDRVDPKNLDAVLFYRQARARGLLREARAEFLRESKTRPKGVATAEFLTAWGYAWPEAEKAREAGLVF
jgi:hypothetical protein